MIDRNRIGRTRLYLPPNSPVEAGTLVSLKPKPQGSESTSCQQRALRFRLIIGGG